MKTELPVEQQETLDVYELSRMVSKMTITDATNLMECLVDKYGLDRTINILSDICGLKADHLIDCWNDHDQAKSWVRDFKKLDRLNLEN